MNKVMLPKDDQALPDQYKMKITYVTGKAVEYEAASHALNDGMLSLWTKDDLHHWIVMQNVMYVDFDKDFTKMMEVKAKHDRNKLDIKAGGKTGK